MPHLRKNSYPSIESAIEDIEQAYQGDKKRVAILGAGIAGLVSAYELERLGYEVQIFEASHRIGGRIWTHYFGGEASDSYGELGAMRIPGSHDYTRYYIDLVGLTPRLRRFITSFENSHCFLDMRGVVARMSEGQKTIYPQYQLNKMEQSVYPASRLFAQQMDKTISSLSQAEINDLFEGNISSPLLNALNGYTLCEYLESITSGLDAMELINSFTSLQGWQDKALTMFIRDVIINTSSGLQEIAGGSQQLPNALAKKIKGKIYLNTEICQITKNANGVNLSIKEHGSISSYQADYVICTIPYSVMTRMSLLGFSAGKMQAIHALNYAASTKILLHCRERFWESIYHIYGGASISDSVIRQVYYPSDHADAIIEKDYHEKTKGVIGAFTLLGNHVKPKQNVSDDKPGVLLASYTWGQDANRLAVLDKYERGSLAQNMIARFHPEILQPGMVMDVESMAWGEYRWSAGAFAFLWPHQLKNFYHATIKNEGTLFFAGEHCSTDQAWIQGAIVSALRTVRALVDAG